MISESYKLCASVFATTKSTPSKFFDIILLIALPPPPPTPITVILGFNKEEAIERYNYYSSLQKVVQCQVVLVEPKTNDK